MRRTLTGSGRQVVGTKSASIDIDSLASQPQASAYLLDKLHEILEDDACAPERNLHSK